MVAAGGEDLDAVGGFEVSGIGVLAPDGEDGLPDLAAIACFGSLPERVLTGNAPRLGRLALTFDDLGHERDRVGVETDDRSAVKRLPAEEDRLTETEVVDAADVVGAQGPVEVRRVAARHHLDVDAEARLDRLDDRRERSHVLDARLDPVSACEVRSDAPQADVGETQGLTDGVVQVLGEYALTEIPELHHEHDVVGAARSTCRGRQRGQDLDLGIHAHHIGRDDSLDLARHRRPQQQHGGIDARVAHPLDVLDAGIAQEIDEAQRVGKFGGTEHRLGDRGDRDVADATSSDELVGVGGDLVETDVQAGAVHATAIEGFCSRCGNAREDHVEESVGRSADGVGDRDAEFAFVLGDRGGELAVGHVLVVEGQADHLGLGERLDQADLTCRRRHGECREIADGPPCGRMLENHCRREAPSQDRGGAEIGGMAERTLAFDDDHVGATGLEGFDDSPLQLAGDELRGDGIQRHAVASPLHQARLAGPHENCPDPVLVQCPRQDRGRRPFPDGAIGAENRNTRAGHLADAAGEHAKVRLGTGSADIGYLDGVDRRGPGELGIVVQELVQSVDDAQTSTHGPEENGSFSGRQQPARGGHAHDEQLGWVAGSRQGLVEVSADRNPIRLPVEHHPCVLTCRSAVDHREDLVPFAVTNQPIRRLAIDRSEVGLAIHDRLRPSGRWGRGGVAGIPGIGHSSPRVELRGGEKELSGQNERPEIQPEVPTKKWNAVPSLPRDANVSVAKHGRGRRAATASATAEGPADGTTPDLH